MFMMSAFFRTGTISIAASICSIILFKSDSKSSFPKPAQTFTSYYILNYTENTYILDTVMQFTYMKAIWNKSVIMFKLLPSYMRKNGAHKSIVTCRIKFIVTAVTLSFIHICLTLVLCKFNNEVERKWRNTETSFHVKTHLFFSICQQLSEGRKILPVSIYDFHDVY